MGEWTISTTATSVVGEMHADRRAFRGRVMREVADFGAVGTGSLGEWPAEGDLISLVLIWTSEAPGATTYTTKGTGSSTVVQKDKEEFRGTARPYR